jgi:hypothetical protein
MMGGYVIRNRLHHKHRWSADIGSSHRGLSLQFIAIASVANTVKLTSDFQRAVNPRLREPGEEMS